MSNSPSFLASTRAWVIDVDGCLMRTKSAGGVGGVPIDGAPELIRDLYAAGHEVVVCTNASERTPAAYAEHLRNVGIPVRDEDFITAGSAAAEYIAHHHEGARVLVLGTEGITDPLTELGVELADPADLDRLADVVMVGAGENFSRQELNAASLAVNNGAPLYTTVEARWFHGGLGKSICVSAAIAHAVGWVAGVTPQVLGKPSAGLAETLTRRFTADAERTTVVGDATAEIKLARLMGANAALVLSGATTAADLEAMTGDEIPDGAYPDVSDIHTLLSSTSLSSS